MITSMLLVIGVDFLHGGLHVHYDLPARLNRASTLQSLADAPESWLISVEPRDAGNGAVELHAVIEENGTVIGESKTILTIGETVTIISKLGNDEATLTLAPAFR